MTARALTRRAEELGVDEEALAAADEAAARYVAMRVRRGRAFEADFEPPTRRADTDATLVGPAL